MKSLLGLEIRGSIIKTVFPEAALGYKLHELRLELVSDLDLFRSLQSFLEMAFMV
jgi:hypothetical protein